MNDTNCVQATGALKMGNKHKLVLGELNLESEATLSGVDIVYHTYGSLNSSRSNVIWVFHALTANSDVADWWAGLMGEGKVIDPKKYFIVCANVLGSCYGSTGPLTVNPNTGKPYYRAFPILTIRDMVSAHIKLRIYLGIESIQLGIGGSLGGQQLLEWALQEPDIFEHIIPIATNARHSPWGIAFNESQRWAIETDPTWAEQAIYAGEEGLKVARSIAMLSYRNYKTYEQAQLDDIEKSDWFKTSSYQRYQGAKLAARFNAFSYWYLSKAMDSQNLARGRGLEIEEALGLITAKSTCVGINSDILFPPSEQAFLAQHIPNATYHEVVSIYGHDGFLLEYEQLSRIIKLDILR